jgi:hypothetical protein
MMSLMPDALDIRRSTIDGIPVLSADLETIPTATLTFAVGTRHETPQTSGIAHLVEHVVMRRVGYLPVLYQAVTGPGTISFMITGDDDAMVDFLDRVCESIRHLAEVDLDDIELERKTIAVEIGDGAEDRSDGLWVRRFGLRDLGLLDLRSPGVRNITPEAVREFATRHLHGGNAGLVVTGAVPARLRLQLPEPTRHPEASGDPISSRADLPAWTHWEGAPVALSFELRTDVPQATAVRACLEAAFMRRLRFERGLIYSIEHDVMEIEPGRLLVTLALDPLTAELPEAYASAVELFRDLAENGPAESELEFARQYLAAMSVHSSWAAGYLQESVVELIRGVELPDFRAEIDGALATEADDVASALRDALPTLLVSTRLEELPVEIVERAGLDPLPLRTNVLSVGSILGSAKEQIRESLAGRAEMLSPRRGTGLKGLQLYITDEQMTFISDDRAFKFGAEEVALVGRSGTGLHHVILDDGTTTTFHPDEWKDGAGWIPRFLRGVPPDRFYEMAD